MIVIERNGRATVITGWRAWLISAVAFVGVAIVMAIVVFFLFGLALTIGAVLLVLVPTAAIIALLISLFGRTTRRL